MLVISEEEGDKGDSGMTVLTTFFEGDVTCPLPMDTFFCGNDGRSFGKESSSFGTRWEFSKRIEERSSFGSSSLDSRFFDEGVNIEE